MNVLILAEVDHTGAACALSQAINDHTEHSARAVSYRRTWLHFPYDILNPSDDQLRDMLVWADVVNVHDQALRRLKGMPVRPVVMTYHGSYYRKRWQQLNRRDAARGYKATAFTIGLSRLGPRWIGRPIGDLSGMHDPSPGVFRVHHCATRPDKKGTAEIAAIVGDMAGVELDVVSGVSNMECLRRRSWCHAVVDRFGGKAVGTIGTTAIESFSMGLPVISWATPDDLRYIKSTIGYVPFISAVRSRDLAAAVRRLKDDPEFYAEKRELGRRYVSEWHDPAMMARKFVGYVS